jgi:NAD(P)-dependent dehydrogenase (short-subunit alcohol dehydrogenase family)
VSDARSDALKGAPSGALIVTGGGRGIAIRADVSVEADIVRAFEQVDRELGGVRALVNNAASKAAVETMSIGLSKELAETGIRVNTVRCGVIDTEVHHAHGEDRVRALMAQVPMRRMGAPDEVAAAVLSLLSDEAS